MNGEVNWEMNFVTLEKFLKDGNPCSISKIERFDKTVGIWAANQRKRNQKGMLRTDRKERLEAIGFNFGESRKSRPQSLGRAQRDKWENMFQRLLEFKHENGHAVVPHKYEKDRALALWVSTQRREYNKKSWYGANRTMREDRRERLDAIGFVWDNLSNKKQARTESTKANSNDNRQTSTTSQVSPVDSSAGNSLPNTKNDSTIICIEV